MTWGLFILGALWLVVPSYAAAPDRCEFFDGLKSGNLSELPATVRMGAVNVYKYRLTDLVDTAWQPIAYGGVKARLDNLNALSFDEPLPDRFIVADGGLTRAAMGIDKRPGTELDRLLDELKLKVLATLKARHRKVRGEQIVDFIAHELPSLFDGRWSLGVDKAGDNRWDPKVPGPSKESLEKFATAEHFPIGAEPVPTDERLPVVPFERFLTDRCSSYCFQKALLAKMLFEKFEMPAKVVTGATGTVKDGKPSTSGHSWVEMPDLTDPTQIRAIDPTHQLNAVKGPAHDLYSDWFSFGVNHRFHNVRWPILILQE